jgi:hypothetical protein
MEAGKTDQKVGGLYWDSVLSSFNFSFMLFMTDEIYAAKYVAFLALVGCLGVVENKLMSKEQCVQ